MPAKNYHFVTRPTNVAGQYPFLVFDRRGRLHFQLTIFAKSALAQLAASTARTYLYSILSFFNYLEEDIWQVRACRRWDSDPDEIRIAVRDFLVLRLQCKVRDHRLGFEVVAITTRTHSHIHVLLSALKLFYRIMCVKGYYAYENPLVDRGAEALAAAQEIIEEDSEIVFPRMPAISGVVEPRHSRRRLSDSYFRLEGEEWIPKIIDDPEMPSLVHRGGDLVGWKLREWAVTNLLFESGGRVSEVSGLTLGDWVARGMKNEASAFSKGSRGRRVKFFRFSNDTAKLLRRYFNTERCKHDPHGYKLEDYLRLAKHKQIDLYDVPLFLTAQGTQLTPQVYRDLYWNPACEAVGLNADVHQTRHWYVTQAIRHIYETSSGAEIARRKEDLIVYMAWKSKETLQAYEHYFSAIRHTEDMVAAAERRDRALRESLEGRHTRPFGQQDKISTVDSVKPSTEPDDVGFDFLRRIGGIAHD
jgi:integrase